MTAWADFNVCVREKIDDYRFHLAMTHELYRQVMKADPGNMQKRGRILMLEQPIM
jgi:hypothetical protein